ncbi:MAG TPA: hypothetical protein VMB81_09065 [Candidatus Sulfotelmatobacter sp.]|nr:hypothetical protein [Candidatus Sulfotelmatobacter sp.]
MRRHSVVGPVAIAAAALSLVSGLAQASECGEQIRLLDDRYSLAVVQPGDRDSDHPGQPGSDQTAASGAGGAPASTAGIDSVPNTGGIAMRRDTPVNPLRAAQRERMREALLVARRADQAGDGTTCAAKLAEARRLAQGETAEPHAK